MKIKEIHRFKSGRQRVCSAAPGAEAPGRRAADPPPRMNFTAQSAVSKPLTGAAGRSAIVLEPGRAAEAPAPDVCRKSPGIGCRAAAAPVFRFLTAAHRQAAEKPCTKKNRIDFAKTEGMKLTNSSYRTNRIHRIGYAESVVSEKQNLAY